MNKTQTDPFEKAASIYSRQAIKSPKLRKCRALASRRATKKYGDLLNLERQHGYGSFKVDQWNAYYQDIIAACTGRVVGMRAAGAIKKHSQSLSGNNRRKR